ncbi:Nudix hydrolase 9 isoform I [Glycine soja]|uniref:Nudix hydrolase 9 isoform H n=1 Tax=Glycine soja TaxID=3848 RepID=A0A445HM62_GLYSO|nr:Nudix hydrolase 9 isoform H [Glycine soja]RZB74800.1 Nudix hydrolase 9 isoform I [Glycine soja]
MEKEASSTDDPSSFTLLVSCPSGLSPSQVRFTSNPHDSPLKRASLTNFFLSLLKVSVAFSDAYDRIPHSDVILENTISEIWKQRSQKNNSLFNGKKFRYGGCVLHAKDGSDHECEPHLCLHLGLTDYRTFVGTNLSPLWERFLVPSEDDSVLCQHTSNPLGNGAVVETNDNKILVLQRSDNVGEFPGHFVFPGGHPEICNLRSTDAALQRCVRCWTNARHGCGPDSYAMRYRVRSPSLDMVGPTDMRDWTRTR